jgi:polysaccharide biosynthesis protein PslH
MTENTVSVLRKKIFVLLSRVPYPLEKGDKLRAFHQIKELSGKHDIILCALSDTNVSSEAKTFLQPFVKELYIFRLSRLGIMFRLFLCFFTNMPFQVAYFYKRGTNAKIKKLIKKHNPEYVYCQLIRTAEYIKDLNVNKTLDYQDVFSRGLYRRWQVAPWYKKIIIGMEYRRVLRYEATVFDCFNKKTIISYPDRDLIPHMDRDQIEVIPNGVDFTYFGPNHGEKIYDIIFTGNMAYPPNINGATYLIRKVMPIVWRHIPGVTVVLAGANPSLYVRSLQSDRVLVTGWVNDMRDFYSQSKIFVAPMQIGTGMQNKVLEAMAMGLPCITSSLANDALNAPEGTAVLVGKDSEDFAKHIITLLNNPDRCEQLAANGHHFVREHYQWSNVGAKLMDVITRED